MTIVLFGTVRANGAVIGPLIILAIGLLPVRLGFALGAYPWLGADALWLSFPVGSLANMAMAIAFYLHGGWRKARMGMPPPREALIEEAQADGEPGGRINPSAWDAPSQRRVRQVRLVLGVGLAVVDLDIDVARRDLALRQARTRSGRDRGLPSAQKP